MGVSKAAVLWAGGEGKKPRRGCKHPLLSPQGQDCGQRSPGPSPKQRSLFPPTCVPASASCFWPNLAAQLRRRRCPAAWPTWPKRTPTWG